MYSRRVDWRQGDACGSLRALGQVHNGQNSNPFGQRIAIGCAADNSSGSNAGLARYIADEIEIHCITRGGDLSPLCLEQLETPANIYHEVHLTSAVTPEEQTLHPFRPAFACPQLSKHERFPDRTRCRRLAEVFF